MIEFNIRVIFLILMFIQMRIVCMHDVQDRPDVSSRWSKVRSVYGTCVVGAAFAGQYFTIKNYYQEYPQTDDLTGVWSGIAVAFGIGAVGGLLYVTSKYLVSCDDQNLDYAAYDEYDENTVL